MNYLSKILVTIVVVVLYMGLSAVVMGIRTDAGMKTPGIFGMILLAALIGALKAIWKKPKKNNDNMDNSVLQK